MTILQVLPRLNSGGVERGTVDLAKYFAGMGTAGGLFPAGRW